MTEIACNWGARLICESEAIRRLGVRADTRNCLLPDNLALWVDRREGNVESRRLRQVHRSASSIGYRNIFAKKWRTVSSILLRRTGACSRVGTGGGRTIIGDGVRRVDSGRAVPSEGEGV
jgi:hypothetical protein